MFGSDNSLSGHLFPTSREPPRCHPLDNVFMTKEEKKINHEMGSFIFTLLDLAEPFCDVINMATVIIPV